MHENIPWGQVTVYDTAQVAVRYALSNLAQVLPQNTLIERLPTVSLLLYEGGQVSSFSIVHDDVEDRVFLVETSQGDDEVALKGLQFGSFFNSQIKFFVRQNV